MDVNGTLAVDGQLIDVVAKETLLASDLVAPTIISALELLEKPMRIVASSPR